jgi:N6-adenosine-specific RNA methylase IME4
MTIRAVTRFAVRACPSFIGDPLAHGLGDPTLRYPIVLADPPYYFEGYTSAEAYDRAPHYPTMRIDQICALPVRDLATDAAILFLWTTSAHQCLAFDVIEAWGFIYSTSAVWVKTECAPGLGHIVRQQHETLLIARRGDFPGPPPSTRPSSVITAPRRDQAASPMRRMPSSRRCTRHCPRSSCLRAVRRGPAGRCGAMRRCRKRQSE